MNDDEEKPLLRTWELVVIALVVAGVAYWFVGVLHK